jgi:UDP-N-acetylglucosamine enolpyruvyl transferase
MKKLINNQIGKYVIVRADKAGVFFGKLIAKNDLEVQLTDCRKLYYWSGANAVEQIAMEGVKNIDDCKFTIIVDEVTISNYIQIITCTDIAVNNINSVPIWKK